jgi:solute carrier family 25 phosphate transporter 23/24/25/41
MKVRDEEPYETQNQLVRRVTRLYLSEEDEEEESQKYKPLEDTPAAHKFLAGAAAGTTACLACYPLDLVRTRLTTELEGREHYRGILDAFRKIATTEGLSGFYSGIGPTLLVAVPNFGVSYTVYGTLKEYTLDDDLFYNLRKIDADSGEPKLGFLLTIMCGAASGIFATLMTFPMDTIRRRMQVQNLHIPPEERLSPRQQFMRQITAEGFSSLYRGLTPEILKVVPMVGTMFMVYEWSKDLLNVSTGRR